MAIKGSDEKSNSTLWCLWTPLCYYNVNNIRKMASS